MVCGDYLSLLSWQNLRISHKDFQNLQERKVRSVEDIRACITDIESRRYIASSKDCWQRAESDYKRASKQGYHITWPGKKDYPSAFFKLNRPPATITYLGCLSQSKASFPITIVGSRNMDEISCRWLDFYLPKVIEKYKLHIISGGARGIDQKAHYISLRLQRPTLCFLPSGLDHIYPRSLNENKKYILDKGGAFVSCFPPHFKMYKSFFHIRNQLMAVYSSLLFVVQAQRKSGTMLTAQKALDYGIPVGVLPGSPLSFSWQGNLQLLYDGAYLIRDDQDLSLLIEGLKVNS